MSTIPRKSYPSDVTDDEWTFVAPYLTLMTPDAPSAATTCVRSSTPCAGWCGPARRGAICPGICLLGRPSISRPSAGSRPGTLWVRFEDMVHDLRALLRAATGRDPDPTAVILDARTRRGTPESGHRAGDDGHKKTRGSKLHAAVDTLGHLLALRVTPASEQERAQVGDLADAVQAATGNTVELAWVDQGYTGEEPAQAAAARGIELIVLRVPGTKQGFVLLPRRWVVERSFAWATRFRRLAKD